jgi:hypothetical protein
MDLMDEMDGMDIMDKGGRRFHLKLGGYGRRF